MKVIHRFWTGPKAMPEEYVEYGRLWRQLNPDWMLHDWSMEDLPPLENAWVLVDLEERSTSDPVALAVQQADVLAYELVWRYGGIYVNCDILPVRPLSTIMDIVGDRAYAGYEDEQNLVNAVMGGPPKHRFWRAVMDELPQRYARMAGGEMPQVTGRDLITGVYHSRQWDDFVAIGREVFNPVHFHQVPVGGRPPEYDWKSNPVVVGIHQWGHRMFPRDNYVR